MAIFSISYIFIIINKNAFKEKSLCMYTGIFIGYCKKQL